MSNTRSGTHFLWPAVTNIIGLLIVIIMYTIWVKCFSYIFMRDPYNKLFNIFSLVNILILIYLVYTLMTTK